MPPNSGAAGKVRVLLPTVTINCVLPAAALAKLTVQLRLCVLLVFVPVHDATKLLAPCRKLTCVLQLLAVLLQGMLVPVSVKAKLDNVPLARLPSYGDILATRGKAEFGGEHQANFLQIVSAVIAKGSGGWIIRIIGGHCNRL